MTRLAEPAATQPPPVPRTTRAWDLRVGDRVGHRSVERIQTGSLHARNLPVVRVWWRGDDPQAAPTVLHPWAQLYSRPSTQPGARWLTRECYAYATRHPEGWTLEGMRAHVGAVVEAGGGPQ